MENNMHNNNINTPDNYILKYGDYIIYDHDIYSVLDDYISEHNNIDLVHDINQYMWKDVLYYIHDRLFYNKSVLKNDNNNYYNDDVLLSIYNIYKRICIKYNKITFIADFSILTGIDESVISTWSNRNSVGFNARHSELHKSVLRDSETAIATQMISTGRNPVGYMAILNHYHGWATAAAAHGDVDSRRTPEEIAESHGIAIESQTAPELPPPSFVGVPSVGISENIVDVVE